MFSVVIGPQPPLASMFYSLGDAMLIRAETVGQSLRIHGKKGSRGGREQKREKEKKEVEKKVL